MVGGFHGMFSLSETLRTGLKASTWTFMVRAIRNEGKLRIAEVKVTGQQKKAKKLKARRENNSGRI